MKEEKIHYKINTRIKLNPYVKRQWVAALRSGDYEQTDGFLYSEGEGFCCMGVLCHARGHSLSALDKVGMPEGVGSDMTGFFDKIARTDSSQKTTLGDMFADFNDSEGYSFAQIATFIEENL